MSKTTIPIGWKQVKASDILDIRDGTHDSPKKSEVGVPLLTSKNIVNGEISFHNFYNISETDVLQINKRSKVEKGDILVSMIGTVGESALIKEDPNFVIKNVGLFRKNEEEILSRFLIKQFHSRKLKGIIRSFLNGGIQKFIGLGDLRKLPILLPPLPEQEKIVEVLETWDNYLEKLAKIIKVKKKIKKGLRQFLLTEKVRLEKFEKPWNKVKLGEISQIVSGGTPSTKIESYWNGDIPWISSSDLVLDNIYSINIHRYISPEAIKNSATKVIPEQSILLVSRVGVGKIAVNTVQICTSQDFQSITNSKGCFDANFLANLLTIEIQKFLQVNQGSFIKGFLKNDLENLAINLPPLPEQTAIAQILTTADQEIETLEKKKTLIEAQKKFLLNNLVTGKIRLPEFINAT